MVSLLRTGAFFVFPETSILQIFTRYQSVMPEFITSPIFLTIAAILAILLVIVIIKGALRLLIWLAIIAVILIGFGFITQGDLREWLENLRKIIA